MNQNSWITQGIITSCKHNTELYKELQNNNNDNKQKHISSWRKELSIIPEPGTGSDNGKLNRKKRKIFQKYRVTNAREVAQLTETLKQNVQTKAQRIRRYEKRET